MESYRTPTSPMSRRQVPLVCRVLRTATAAPVTTRSKPVSPLASSTHPTTATHLSSLPCDRAISEV